MSGIQQNFAYGRSFGPPPWPVTNIGDAYGGGFFGGQINDSNVIYNLVVSPKAFGDSQQVWWTNTSTFLGVTSAISGPTNSATMALNNCQSAKFCENLSIGGYDDWYLPAKNELEVLYYFLKPSTILNQVQYGSIGANINAVLPEPVNTPYSSTAPGQTTSTAFITGGSQSFISQNLYWSSTEFDESTAWNQDFGTGYQNHPYKNSSASYIRVRAIRRVLA